jgi:hypothetical protein
MTEGMCSVFGVEGAVPKLKETTNIEKDICIDSISKQDGGRTKGEIFPLSSLSFFLSSFPFFFLFHFLFLLLLLVEQI